MISNKTIREEIDEILEGFAQNVSTNLSINCNRELIEQLRRLFRV